MKLISSGSIRSTFFSPHFRWHVSRSLVACQQLLLNLISLKLSRIYILIIFFLNGKLLFYAFHKSLFDCHPTMTIFKLSIANIVHSEGGVIKCRGRCVYKKSKRKVAFKKGEYGVIKIHLKDVGVSIIKLFILHVALELFLLGF